ASKVDVLKAWTAAEESDYRESMRLTLRAAARWQEMPLDSPHRLGTLWRLFDVLARSEALARNHKNDPGILELLLERRRDLGPLVRDNPGNLGLRRQLALVCLLLGVNREAGSFHSEAKRSWIAARDEYKRLIAADPMDLVSDRGLAQCCTWLLPRQADD